MTNTIGQNFLWNTVYLFIC